MGFRRRWPGVSYGRGEDWHTVGEAGEPAFEAGWSNASATSYPKMSFRLREAGVVDIVGCVTTDGTDIRVFVLPDGYRPTNAAGIMPYVRHRSASKTGQLLVVNSSGYVIPTDGYTAGDIAYISGSFYLNSPSAIS